MPAKAISCLNLLLPKMAELLKWNTANSVGLQDASVILNMKITKAETCEYPSFFVVHEDSSVSMTKKGLCWAFTLSDKILKKIPLAEILEPLCLKYMGYFFGFRAKRFKPLESLVPFLLSEITFHHQTYAFDALEIRIKEAIRNLHSQNENPFFVVEKRNNKKHIALSYMAADASISLNGLSETFKPNITSQFFEVEGVGVIMDALIKGLASAYPRSREMDLLEDHAQNFILRKVATNAFSCRFAKGKPVNKGLLVSWCKNSAKTDMRDWGVDANTRTTRNALTEKEFKGGQVTKVTSESFAKVAYREEGEEMDFVDNESMRSVEDQLHEKEMMRLIQERLASSPNPEELTKIFEYKIQETTTKEICEKLGCTSSYLKKRLGEIQTLVQRSIEA